MRRIVIIGAGPAGMAAAGVLAEHGERPILLDEAERPGGQIWRTPSPAVAADPGRVLGRTGAAEHVAGHDAFAAVRDRVDHRPRHLAWTVQNGEVFVARENETRTIPYDALLLATGATDRLLPLPGWTIPGVFSLGGAQTLLKDQGAAIGRRVVFAGASPLLYLAALQYRRMGVEVAAVLDTTRFAEKLRAMPALARTAPRTLSRGLGYMAKLRAGGVPILHGISALAVEGTARAEGVRFRDASGAEQRIACDAVALGFGLRAETQLADLAGAALRFDPDFRQWLPAADAEGRCGPGLYAAGDGCAIGGAEAAAISGRLAAWAILADGGAVVPGAERASLLARLDALRRFQRGLTRAFAWPAHWLPDTPPDTILCRCEGITLGGLRDAATRPLGPRDVNRAKALTRCGMGRCQGRFCGLATAEALADTLGLPLETVGRLRGQAPVKPIPLDATLAAEVAP
ncbi:FAD-dependent oxidoreductase [Muricoccus radiodurans]|uniref:FAD/NAD(P)-dependent oxidoreductase n=1 Tax=Muricoccus radiodurans TaxID=2231721 RepID=UPI003CF91431